MSRLWTWVRAIGRRVKTRIDGEVFLRDGQHELVARRDAELQREVEDSWVEWNTMRAAGPLKDIVGISCSGGGIRSAAFNLGALQELRRAGVLGQAAWMSAVSGGSYIAAAHYLVQADFTYGAEEGAPSGDDEDAARQKERRRYEESFAKQPAYELGSPEERWLRSNSSYMADGWWMKMLLAVQILIGAFLIVTAVASVLTLLAIPAGVAGVTMFPGLGDSVMDAERAVTVVHVSRWTVAGLAVLCLSLVCAIATVGFRLTERQRATVRQIGITLALVAVTILAFTWLLPKLVLALRVAVTPAADASADRLRDVLLALGLGGLSPLVVTAFGVLVSRVRDLEPATRSRIAKVIGPKLPPLVAAIATPILFAAIFLSAYNWTTLRSTTTAWVTFLLVGAGLALLAVFIDPTSASMHTYYKRRLASAFDVVRTSRFADGPLDYASPRDGDELTKLSRSTVPGMPKLVVAAAANISNKGATPTGRNAVPFAFSADWVGGPEIGWIGTKELEGRLNDAKSRHVRKDITLLASVAMSGAAVSPSMGKMTKPAYRVLLTLANARLGVWLPNPRYSRTVDEVQGANEIPDTGRKGMRAVTPGAVRPAGPRSRPSLAWLFREMAGLMSRDARRIYVTDGGHYENLGLIELLRRRCTVIYCFDASGDPPHSFTTLAQTLALARTELGVDIPADPGTLREHVDGFDVAANGGSAPGTVGIRPQAKRSHAVIPFVYPPDAKVAGHSLGGRPTERTGVLIYVKCRVTGSAPWDVRALYERDAAFPDHSTADQLYTEERLEAYRALGAHLARDVLGDLEVRRHARHLMPPPGPTGRPLARFSVSRPGGNGAARRAPQP